MSPPDLRNVAIIAHVDHGKTTLVDRLLATCGVFRANQVVVDCVLDANPLERERGITILSKNAAVQHRGVKINIIDTPGHADFGGEVERVIRMADGALLVVDAVDGPMPQTRFVLEQAFRAGLSPVVVINKIDRPQARCHEVVSEVFDLFVEMGASDAQLDFPVVYTSAREGYAVLDPTDARVGMEPLLDTILARVPPPRTEPGPLLMQVMSMDYNDYVGRIAIGKIVAGRVVRGQRVAVARGQQTLSGEVADLQLFGGLGKQSVEAVEAGEIAAVVGLEDVELGDTICDPERVLSLPPLQVEAPTVTLQVSATDSPFRGREGRYVTSRQLRDRLYRELRSNLALRVEDTGQPDIFNVSGRGLLHLGILMENMRREGFEFQVSRPRVILRDGPDGQEEPFEEAVVDVPEDYAGKVMEILNQRHGRMQSMAPMGGVTRLVYRISSRGLFGVRTRILNATRGLGALHHVFREYGPLEGEMPRRGVGVLVASEDGVAVAFALYNIQERGMLFIVPGVPVYRGMIIGEHAKPGDLPVNACKQKHLTNIRAAGKDDAIRLVPPRPPGLEEALEYLAEDELVEITPESIRLRKRHLDEKERRRIERGLKG